MICDRCKSNKATIFYRETVNGIEKTYALCDKCANELKAQGMLNITGFGANDYTDFVSPVESILQSIFMPIQGAGSEIRQPGVVKRCPLCGSTLEQIAEEGKVGCAKCYDTFSDELNGTIRRIHGNGKHIGRVPPQFGKKPTKESEIADLEKQLKDSITSENYELSAKLRDKIKELKNNQEKKNAN